MVKKYISCLLIVGWLCHQAVYAEKQITPIGNYIAGGIMGTLIGLGTGQAINGTYPQTGWAFTVFEGAFGVGLLTAGLVLAYQTALSIFPTLTATEFASWKWVGEYADGTLQPAAAAQAQAKTDPNYVSQQTAKLIGFTAMAGVGAIIFVAFRVWDIVDVWTRPVWNAIVSDNEVVAGKSSTLAIAPFWDGKVFGLSANF